MGQLPIVKDAHIYCVFVFSRYGKHMICDLPDNKFHSPCPTN